MKKIKLNTNYKVLTPNGFKHFDNLRMLLGYTYLVKTKNATIEVTDDHGFSVNGLTSKLSDLSIGDRIQVNDNYEEILSITPTNKIKNVYDLTNVKDGNVYYTNNILSHNCFLETGNSAVDADVIELFRSTSSKPEYVYENECYKIWFPPDETHLYVIGVDVGEGIGQAASVAQIIDITDLTDIRVVATYHNNKIDPFHFGEVLYKIANQWGRPMLAIERNNCGGQVIDALKQTHNYHNIVDHTPKTMSNGTNYYTRLGIYSHTNSKYQGVINMRYWMNSLKVVKLYDISLVQELETFVKYPNGTWKAKAGDYIYDDRVMALIWGLFVLETEIAQKYYEISAYDTRGKPSHINPITVEQSKYFKLDPMYLTDPNAPLPTHVNTIYGSDPEGIEALTSQGWKKV